MVFDKLQQVLNRDPDSPELTTPFKFDTRCEREPTTLEVWRRATRPDAFVGAS